VIFLATLYRGLCADSAAILSFSGASLFAFLAFYAVGVLGYKVGGQHISLEATLHNLAQEQEQLKTVSTALLKSIYVVAANGGALSGMPRTHEELITKYLSQAAKFIEPGAKEAVLEEIKALRATTS
jgi:hypothetical protein